MSKIVHSKEAFSLARRFRPTVYQEWSSIKDFLCPLMLQKNVSLSDFAKAIENPTLYFSVREDEQYWYAYYMKYHPFDWSDNRFFIIRLLDSHRHDDEGLLFRVSKKTNRIDVITVCHYDFLFYSNTDRRVTIERHGHGIHPYAIRKPYGKYLRYNSFSYVNLNDKSERWWQEVKIAFSSNVKMPDEQFASRVLGSPSLRRRNKRGDIFLRPEVLFKTAVKKGWISR